MMCFNCWWVLIWSGTWARWCCTTLPGEAVYSILFCGVLWFSFFYETFSVFFVMTPGIPKFRFGRGTEMDTPIYQMRTQITDIHPFSGVSAASMTKNTQCFDNTVIKWPIFIAIFLIGQIFHKTGGRLLILLTSITASFCNTHKAGKQNGERQMVIKVWPRNLSLYFKYHFEHFLIPNSSG